MIGEVVSPNSIFFPFGYPMPQRISDNPNTRLKPSDLWRYRGMFTKRGLMVVEVGFIATNANSGFGLQSQPLGGNVESPIDSTKSIPATYMGLLKLTPQEGNIQVWVNADLIADEIARYDKDASRGKAYVIEQVRRSLIEHYPEQRWADPPAISGDIDVQYAAINYELQRDGY